MTRQNLTQRVVLILIGGAIAFLGLDFAFGGIPTLGWLVDPAYVTVADPVTYQTQDNHVRFLGGLFVALGAVLAVAGVKLTQMRDTAIWLLAMVFAAGLFRISALDGAVSPAVLPSFLLELIAFPALALWLWRTKGGLGH